MQHPELVEKAQELLHNTSDRATMVMSITADGQVKAVIVSYAFTDRAQRECLEAVTNAAVGALEKIHNVQRSERLN